MKLTFNKCSLEALSGQVYRVRLHYENVTPLHFTAGQYLMLQLGDAQIPLSIASAPCQSEWLELHLRVIPGHELAEKMLAHFRQQRPIYISAPFGRCTLRSGKRPILMIAGGTGLSPAHSMIIQALHDGDTRSLQLFFGARVQQDLYLHDELMRLQKVHQNFVYRPVLEEADDNWQGLTGFPHECAVQQHKDAIGQYDIYVSGSPQMVEKVYLDLLAAGADKAHIYSDILDIRRDNGEAI